jgi:hypothetical protein
MKTFRRTLPSGMILKKRLKELGFQLAQNKRLNQEKRLANIGLDPTDLTPEFLFGSVPQHACSALQALTKRGFLSAIPPDCLPDSVVLVAREYPKMNVRGTIKNFLGYCAATGHYDQLPIRYHEREYVLRNLDRCRGFVITPLHLALRHAKLSSMPLSHLLPGDLDAWAVQIASFQLQLHRLESLLLPSDMDHVELVHNLLQKYWPDWTSRNLTAKRVLKSGDDTLVFAARTCRLDRFPVSLFKHNYCETKQVIWSSIHETSFFSEEYPSAAYAAKKWLIELTKLVLSSSRTRHTTKLGIR